MDLDRCGRHGHDPVWVVVSTKPHRDLVAMDNLGRQDFAAYCPKTWKRIGQPGKSREEARPLFPGYIFVQVDPDPGRWRPILSTYGVRSVLRCGHRLSIVDDAFIDSMKSREVDGVIVRPSHPYRVGQQVRLARGAFDGLVAEIIEMHEKQRITVLLQLLNQQVKVRVDCRQVSELV